MDAWMKIVERAWKEDAFKDRLLDPKQTNAVLEEYMIALPDNVKFVVHQDEYEGTRHLVLPPKPKDDPSLSIDHFGRDALTGDPGF